MITIISTTAAQQQEETIEKAQAAVNSKLTAHIEEEIEKAY